MMMQVIEGGGFASVPLPGRIPYQSIDRYAGRHGIDGEHFALLLHGLAAMDDEFLAVQGEKRAAQP